MNSPSHGVVRGTARGAGLVFAAVLSSPSGPQRAPLHREEGRRCRHPVEQECVAGTVERTRPAPNRRGTESEFTPAQSTQHKE